MVLGDYVVKILPLVEIGLFGGFIMLILILYPGEVPTILIYS